MKKYLLFVATLVFYSLSVDAQYFQDVSQANGLNTYDPDFVFIGTGVSFADFNGDGWDDLTFATAEGHSIFFLQNINGVMTPIPPFVNHNKASKQILWADIDNDGDKDLFVTTYGNGYNRLYENTGNMNMVDITFSAGLLVDFASLSNSATFGDFDKDGFLDLYVSNINTNPGSFTNKLYHNNGNLTFTDVTASTGTSNGNQYTLGNAFLDIDGDNDQDLYLANDRHYTNTMYLNTNNTFTDISGSSNTDIVIDAMNVGVGDYDNDCDLDIYVTNNNAGIPGSALFQNDGTGNFTEVAVSAGVKFLGRTGWAGNWFDMDNDLDQDLYVCSSVEDDPSECNLIYENNGDGTFSTPLPNGLPYDQQNSYANAYGDFNRDGKVDLVVANSPYDWVTYPTPHRLWENVISNNNNWVKVNLEGTTSNRDGIGAWVELQAGGNKYLRYKHCGQAYLSQNGNALHFGLGNLTSIDAITIKWLSGNIDVIENPFINQTHRVIEGQSNPLANDLLSFRVSTNNDRFIFDLEWIAENEESTAFYLLEKSWNGIDYESVATIESKKLATASAYNYSDTASKIGQLQYYRLKIVDEDGSHYFSKVVSDRILTDNENHVSSIYPNPASENIQLNIVVLTNQNASYELINNSGQVILSKPLPLELGNNVVNISIDRVEDGVNFIRLYLENEVITKRFVKTTKY